MDMTHFSIDFLSFHSKEMLPSPLLTFVLFFAGVDGGLVSDELATEEATEVFDVSSVSFRCLRGAWHWPGGCCPFSVESVKLVKVDGLLMVRPCPTDGGLVGDCSGGLKWLLWVVDEGLCTVFGGRYSPSASAGFEKGPERCGGWKGKSSIDAGASVVSKKDMVIDHIEKIHSDTRSKARKQCCRPMGEDPFWIKAGSTKREAQ